MNYHSPGYERKRQNSSHMPLVASNFTDTRRTSDSLCYVRCFPLVLITCFFGCSQSEQAEKEFSLTANSFIGDDINYVVTEAQALHFARNLEESVRSCDAIRSDDLVNIHSIYEIALREINYPEQVEQIYLDAASKQSMMASVISQVRNSGTYHFLRLRKIAGAYHPLFRLVHFDGAFTYHEFELMLNSDGQAIASDFYSTVLGRWMQEDIASTMVSDLNVRGDRVEPSANAQRFLAHIKTFQRMLQAIQSNEMLLEALREFRTLPRELQADRRYLIMATNIAGRISEEELVVEAARFKEHISDELMLDHILLGLMIQQKDTEKSLQIIQRIDERIGGDRFLDLTRANAYLASNRIDEATKSIEGIHLAFPDIYAIYRTRAVLACRRHDFELASRIIREIDAQFGSTIDFGRVMDDKEFEEYAASSEFAAIAESLGTGQ
jgi:hypothetical protein